SSAGILRGRTIAACPGIDRILQKLPNFLAADHGVKGIAFVARRQRGGNSTMTNMPAHTNRLAKETSPYLLQHQHNPVDWYAWGEDAFERARREDKPIFLSVGYSTCYWCHVMERQCFENQVVAAEMN